VVCLLLATKLVNSRISQFAILKPKACPCLRYLKSHGKHVITTVFCKVKAGLSAFPFTGGVGSDLAGAKASSGKLLVPWVWSVIFRHLLNTFTSSRFVLSLIYVYERKGDMSTSTQVTIPYLDDTCAVRLGAFIHSLHGPRSDGTSKRELLQVHARPQHAQWG